jgi:hypothetical protein
MKVTDEKNEQGDQYVKGGGGREPTTETEAV